MRHFRLGGVALLAVLFVIICWFAAQSDYGDTRLIAGPIGFFRSESEADATLGPILASLLLPCIFAVGLWRRPTTLAASVLGLLGWLAVGFWVEAISAC